MNTSLDSAYIYNKLSVDGLDSDMWFLTCV